MSRRLNDPNPLAEAFERAIGRELEPDLADRFGRRVVEFYEEWFDDPERVVKLLERVLELCPSAGWAFDRLKLAFNAAGRWSELFLLYDRRLTAPITPPEAIEILREAAMAAKDFAGDAERAIGYLERLNKLSPGDARVDAALERLYERHAYKRPLIELLSARLPDAGDVDRGELNGRIAALWLDLGEPVPAYEIASRMLGAEREVASAVALLERTLAMPASAEQRLGKKGKNGSVLSNAARLLKDHYRTNGSTVDVVRMLEIEVDCSEERSEQGRAPGGDRRAPARGALGRPRGVRDGGRAGPAQARFGRVSGALRRARRADRVSRAARGGADRRCPRRSAARPHRQLARGSGRRLRRRSRRPLSLDDPLPGGGRAQSARRGLRAALGPEACHHAEGRVAERRARERARGVEHARAGSGGSARRPRRSRGARVRGARRPRARDQEIIARGSRSSRATSKRWTACAVRSRRPVVGTS